MINDLTIIIVLYQEKLELIRSCLKNIKNFKIIIIDNDNNNEIRNKINTEFSIQKYILNKKNIGFTKAANIAIKLVDTKYVMNLNADCIIKENAILDLLSVNQKDHNCFITSPTFYDLNNELSRNSSSFSEKKIVQNNLYLDGDVCVDWVLGSAILFKKEIFDEIGMFDENLFLYFLDEDICRRAFLKNKSTIQLCNVKAIHEHGIPKTKNFMKKIFLRSYNFTFDELYYHYKIDKHQVILNKLKKKVPNYFCKFFLNIFILRIDKSTHFLSLILAFLKFKKFLNNNHQ
jgi:N-acetylglucosaminyl-diphospho-decaprenol L-rhamnosyltransferase